METMYIQDDEDNLEYQEGYQVVENEFQGSAKRHDECFFNSNIEENDLYQKPADFTGDYTIDFTLVNQSHHNYYQDINDMNDDFMVEASYIFGVQLDGEDQQSLINSSMEVADNEDEAQSSSSSEFEEDEDE